MYFTLLLYFISVIITSYYFTKNKIIRLFSVKTIIIFNIVITLNTIIYLLTRILSINWKLTLIPNIIFTILFLIKKNNYTYDFKLPPRKYLIIIFFTLFFYEFPIILQSFRMGIGKFPAEFYSVDTPYYLNFVYTFLKNNNWPITSLTNNGIIFNTHIGTSALAALISLITQIPPHQVYLLILPLLFSFSLFFIIYDIIITIFSNFSSFFIKFLLFLVFLLSTNQFYFKDPSTVNLILHLLNYNTFPFLFGNFNEIFFKIQNYQAYFPLLTSLYGKLLVLIWVRTIFSMNRFNNYFITFIFISCTLIIFKIPYAPLIIYGSILKLYFDYLDDKQSLNFLFIILIIFTNVFFYLILTPEATSFASPTKIIFSPAISTFNLNLIISILIFLIPGIFFYRRNKINKFNKLFLYILLPPILFSCFFTIQNSNSPQLFILLPIFSFLFLMNTLEYSVLYNKVLIFLLFILLIPPIFSNINYINVLLLDKNNSHEYVDNRIIANALLRIPVHGSVIATNDLYYPANNYVRYNRQYQISSIFGHQQYASDLSSTSGSDSGLQYNKNALSIVDALKGNNIDSLNFLLSYKRTGITHFLFNKRLKYLKVNNNFILFNDSSYQITLNPYK